MDNYQYPSVVLSRRHTGDRDLTELYRGEANKLLYQLKNLMQFRQLGQLKMTRLFTDGTVITAWSIFGQDFVNIDVSRTTLIGIAEPIYGIAGECTITFIDLPVSVQPMRYPGEIKAKEVEGVDYHKTYYLIDISTCPTCKDIAWEFLFRYLQSSPLVPPTVPISTREEWPIEPLHRCDYDTNGLISCDETDHTIYSFYPPAWGEIIKHGEDTDGTYIIWKAYTEAKGNPISRTGLGIMRLVARIRDDSDNEMCAQNARVEVDCCLKLEEDRPLIINWEKCAISGWCPAPDSEPMSILTYFQHWSWILMGLKAGGDGCIPYEWSLSGMGEIIPAWGNRKFVTYRVPAWQFYARYCRDSVFIRGGDRCGTSGNILFKSCCDSDPAPVSIGYTSLTMGFNASQNLTVSGGCGPYTWSLSGGGTITQGGVYTAPATNPNCANNPTITVTDCCGTSAQIKIAITGGVFEALCWTVVTFWNIWCDNPVQHCKATGRQVKKQYRCNNTIYYEHDNTYTPGYWHGCNHPDFPNCNKDSLNAHIDRYTSIPDLGSKCVATTGGWHGVWDIRTAANKEAGCCPLNPVTGLPYD